MSYTHHKDSQISWQLLVTLFRCWLPLSTVGYPCQLVATVGETEGLLCMYRWWAMVRQPKVARPGDVALIPKEAHATCQPYDDEAGDAELVPHWLPCCLHC